MVHGCLGEVFVEPVLLALELRANAHIHHVRPVRKILLEGVCEKRVAGLQVLFQTLTQVLYVRASATLSLSDACNDVPCLGQALCDL